MFLYIFRPQRKHYSKEKIIAKFLDGMGKGARDQDAFGITFTEKFNYSTYQLTTCMGKL